MWFFLFHGETTPKRLVISKMMRNFVDRIRKTALNIEYKIVYWHRLFLDPRFIIALCALLYVYDSLEVAIPQYVRLPNHMLILLLQQTYAFIILSLFFSKLQLANVCYAASAHKKCINCWMNFVGYEFCLADFAFVRVIAKGIFNYSWWLTNTHIFTFPVLQWAFGLLNQCWKISFHLNEINSNRIDRTIFEKLPQNRKFFRLFMCKRNMFFFLLR